MSENKYLNGDVDVGVSSVENGSKVELRVSLCFEHLRPDGITLTPNYGINIWSCKHRETQNQVRVSEEHSPRACQDNE